MSELVNVDMKQFGLDESKAHAVKADFDAVLKIAVELEEDYNNIVSQEITPDIASKAKELRLKYVKVRTGIAKVHKERKAFYLSGGRAVDGLKNAYTHAVEGNEVRLKEIETHYERIEQERIEKLQAERVERLSAYVDDAEERELTKFADDEFEALLAMKKREHEERIEAERLAEEQRIAKEKAEAEERERIRKENERLKAEAEAREKAEKERIAKEEAERKRIEAEREAERKEAEAKLRAEREERERIEAEAKAKEEAERKRIEAEKAREHDKAHRKKINNEALDSIISCAEITKEQAMIIVSAIARGEIKNVSIKY